MITIETEICNPISQTFYDDTVLSLDLNLITCTCGHTGCLVWYGSYTRKLRLEDQVISLKIARVFCNSCHHTHALLLSSIVPYSQISLEVHASIAEAYENGAGYNVFCQALFPEKSVKIPCFHQGIFPAFGGH